MDHFPDAPQNQYGAGEGSRFKELDEDEEDGEAMAVDDNNNSTTTSNESNNSWNHLLASTGDDGSLKVWSIPTAAGVSIS